MLIKYLHNIVNYDDSKIIGNRSYGTSASEVIRYTTISMNDYKDHLSKFYYFFGFS